MAGWLAKELFGLGNHKHTFFKFWIQIQLHKLSQYIFHYKFKTLNPNFPSQVLKNQSFSRK